MPQGTRTAAPNRSEPGCGFQVAVTRGSWQGPGEDCPTGPGPGRPAALPQLVPDAPEGKRGTAAVPQGDLALGGGGSLPGGPQALTRKWGQVVPGTPSERVATKGKWQELGQVGTNLSEHLPWAWKRGGMGGRDPGTRLHADHTADPKPPVCPAPPTLHSARACGGLPCAGGWPSRMRGILVPQMGKRLGGVWSHEGHAEMGARGWDLLPPAFRTATGLAPHQGPRALLLPQGILSLTTSPHRSPGQGPATSPALVSAIALAPVPTRHSPGGSPSHGPCHSPVMTPVMVLITAPVTAPVTVPVPTSLAPLP